MKSIIKQIAHIVSREKAKLSTDGLDYVNTFVDNFANRIGQDTVDRTRAKLPLTHLDIEKAVQIGLHTGGEKREKSDILTAKEILDQNPGLRPAFRRGPRERYEDPLQGATVTLVAGGANTKHTVRFCGKFSKKLFLHRSTVFSKIFAPAARWRRPWPP